MRKPGRAGPTWSEYVSAHQRISLRTPRSPLSEEEALRELADHAVLHAWRGAQRRPVLALVAT